jgi:hypothetical protein
MSNDTESRANARVSPPRSRRGGPPGPENFSAPLVPESVSEFQYYSEPALEPLSD